MLIEREALRTERDGSSLSLILAAPEAPRGIVQISHGMAEHKERYLPLMDYLAGKGYACVVHDMRGHGESVQNPEDLGYFGENGVLALVDELAQVAARARGRWPDIPLYLMGHSMGSLIARAYIKRHPEPDGLILSGTPSYQAAVVPAGLLMDGIIRLRGERHRSEFVNKLFFGRFNRGIKNPASAFAWLNTDVSAVDAYDQDPLCGFIFTLNGFKALRGLLIDVYSGKGWAKPEKNIPVLFISGSEDPCMGSREKLGAAANLMRNVGYPHIKTVVFDGMRHEIMNEPGRSTVYETVLAFLAECERA